MCKPCVRRCLRRPEKGVRSIETSIAGGCVLQIPILGTELRSYHLVFEPLSYHFSAVG